MEKKLIIFMPSIEGGGVEKNLFIVSNYLATRFDNLSIVTASKKFNKKFNKKINLICPQSSYWDSLTRRIKYTICLFLLFLELKKNEEIVVFCFQANIYCILLYKFFKTNQKNYEDNLRRLKKNCENQLEDEKFYVKIYQINEEFRIIFLNNYLTMLE